MAKSRLPPYRSPISFTICNRLQSNFRLLLLTGAVALGGLAANPASAHSITITTTGTITSGSDAADLFGLGSSLAGDQYLLVVTYNSLGPSYSTNGLGTFATDIGDPLTGTVTATIRNGAATGTLTSAIVNLSSATLIEDLSDLYATNSGTDGSGNFTYAEQDVIGAADFIPNANLQTGFAYTLGVGDSGSDGYSYSNAADTETASFSGTPSSISAAIPEPTSWALMAVGILGVGTFGGRKCGQ